MKLSISLLIFAGFVVGCGEDETDQSAIGDLPGRGHPFGVAVEARYVDSNMASTSASAADYGSSTLCASAYYADGGAGVFEVMNLTGVAESPAGDITSIPTAYTYAQLRLVDSLGGAASGDVIVRFRGGPESETITQSSELELLAGETVVVLLKGAEADANEGFAGTASNWVWRETSGGTWSNDVDELSWEELTVGITEAYESLPSVDHPYLQECPVQIPWESCPAASLVPADAPRGYDAPTDCGTHADTNDADPTVPGPDEAQSPR